jgi:hypothetical protein
MSRSTRWRARRALSRGRLRWWLVYGPVRSGTTLMSALLEPHTRWSVSDWGLHAVLDGPLSSTPPGFDLRRMRRDVLTEVLAATDTGHGGTLDLVYKQANMRKPEYDALVDVIGPPERSIFCLRDPAGFMRSAVRKFPDTDLDNLRVVNYVGTIAEHTAIGGDVFLYSPEVTGADYSRFLAPIPLSAAQQADVRYTGATADELTTPEMWVAFERMRGLAANAVPA